MNTRTTFRIPESLNNQLIYVAENVGLAETTIMRTSITDELFSLEKPVNPVDSNDQKIRKTVNLNEFVNYILKVAKDKTGQSANDLFIWALSRKLKYYQDILEELG